MLLSGSLAASASKPTPAVTPSVIVLTPARISIQGLYSQVRVLTEARFGTGGSQDVSDNAKLTVADPRIATIDSNGMVRGKHDGATLLIAQFQGRTAKIPVDVHGVTKAAAPRFLNDVIPVLTHAGCNQGACHGAASGKGGFKLSLLGYDPDSDYIAITRSSAARRVAIAQPEHSLLLRKPTLEVAHRGGKRLDIGSPDYILLRDWIGKGMPGPNTTEAHVERLDVTPMVRSLALGKTQRFDVRVRYSDGTVRDVTDQTLFTGSDETVVSVSPGGVAKVVSPGEGAVVIRYQGLVATARVISPFGKPRTDSRVAKVDSKNGSKALAVSAVTPKNGIDLAIQQKLDALGLPASGRCSDSDFMRRAYLDAIGLLPTPTQAREFLNSHDPDKRDKLIDALLDRPEYVDFWTMKWGDLLRDSRVSLSEKGMYALNVWIRRSVAADKPWDQFVRELVLAEGSEYENGAANFYRSAKTPQELAETTSQAFLGVRIQCARCHNHPYDKWTQNQYYQMAAFFARVATKKGERNVTLSGPMGIPDGIRTPAEQVVYMADSGEVSNPRTQKQMQPCALDGVPVPQNFTGDRRLALADWLTSPKNPFFAHSVTNRLWRHFMGRGLVEPVDDLRSTNPPSNAALYDWLADELVRDNFHLKQLMRTIMQSDAYQRSPDPLPGNARDTRFGSHYPFKRMGAEQLLDAVASATGIPELFKGYPAGMHASQLPDTAVPSYFLDLFGRPARTDTCACERSDEPNLGQVLHLMNSKDINTRVVDKTGRAGVLVQAKKPVNEVIEELYLSTLSRYPTSNEARKAGKALADPKKREQTAQDLLWALINSKEFVFNH